MAHQPLSNDALAQLFYAARTHNGFTSQTISDALLHQLYDLMKWAPTSANCSPARWVFVRSPEAKARLLPTLLESNREKTAQAPVTVLIGTDYTFFEHLPELFPHTDARSWFVGKPALIEATAFRNASLQGAYLMMAARALGLDCGPMSGFDADAVNREFFAQQAPKPSGLASDVRVNFICNIGYGDSDKLFGRSPRFDFSQVCQIC